MMEVAWWSPSGSFTYARNVSIVDSTWPISGRIIPLSLQWRGRADKNWIQSSWVCAFWWWSLLDIYKTHFHAPNSSLVCPLVRVWAKKERHGRIMPTKEDLQVKSKKLELKSCKGLGFTLAIVGQSEQWTNSHQHAIHLEPVITQLWMDFNWVSPRQLNRPCR